MDKTQAEARKIETKAGVHIALIVSHFVSIGEQRAKALTNEQIKAVYESEKAKEQEAEKRGAIYLVAPEFSKAILEGCYMLAYNDHRKDIIKAYL